MSKALRSVRRFPFVRRLWKPVVVTGAGGSALLIWLEEILAFVVEYIGVILLPVLTVVIYLYNIFLFRAFEPKIDDLKK